MDVPIAPIAMHSKNRRRLHPRWRLMILIVF
jgi:hypothetical protein